MRKFSAIIIIGYMILSLIIPVIIYGKTDNINNINNTNDKEDSIANDEIFAVSHNNITVKTVKKDTNKQSAKNKKEVKHLSIHEEFTEIENGYKELFYELKNTDNKEEWFKKYKQFIYDYKYQLEDTPETIYDYYTDDELNLLFGVVQAEVGDEYPFECKCNVASVIYNRLEHKQFGNSIDEVLIRSQFSSISDGRYRQVTVSETTILACEYAFEIENTAQGCLYFESGNSSVHSRYAKYIFADKAHKFFK